MHQMTTGAANDFERATDLARNMVMRWGMSDVLGTRVYGDNQSEVFLGRDVMTHKNMSNAVAEAVDKEIRRIIDEQYARARAIIEENRDKVEKMTKTLLEWETLDSEQINAIMAGKEPRPPADVGGSPKDDAGSPKKPSGKAVKPRLDAPAGEH